MGPACQWPCSNDGAQTAHRRPDRGAIVISPPTIPAAAPPSSTASRSYKKSTRASVAFLSPSPPHRLCSSLCSSATLCCLSPPCQPPVVAELGHPLLVLNCVAIPERSLQPSCACKLSRRLVFAPPRTSPSPAGVEPPPV
jgi:hypothetical protein